MEEKENLISKPKLVDRHIHASHDSQKEVITKGMPPRLDGRIATGIVGFDILCQGGFKPNSINYLIGGPGTGKTTFALTFLYHGCKFHNEPGLFVTLEQSPEEVVEDMKRFCIDLQPYREKGLLTIQRVTPSNVTEMITDGNSEIKTIMATKGIKRLAFDSVTEVGMVARNEPEKRLELNKIFTMIKRYNITSIMIAEHQFISLNEYEPEMDEFEADSISCIIHRQRKDLVQRGIQITKMRGTNHNQEAHPLNIVDGKGIVVNYQQTMDLD